MKDKVYSMYGVVDLDQFNIEYKDYIKEYGNEYGLLPNEIKQFSEIFKQFIQNAMKQDLITKKKSLQLLEELFNKLNKCN